MTLCYLNSVRSRSQRGCDRGNTQSILYRSKDKHRTCQHRTRNPVRTAICRYLWSGMNERIEWSLQLRLSQWMYRTASDSWAISPSWVVAQPTTWRFLEMVGLSHTPMGHGAFAMLDVCVQPSCHIQSTAACQSMRSVLQASRYRSIHLIQNSRGQGIGSMRVIPQSSQPHFTSNSSGIRRAALYPHTLLRGLTCTPASDLESYSTRLILPDTLLCTWAPVDREATRLCHWPWFHAREAYQTQ